MNAKELREQYEMQYHEETGKNPYALMIHCGAHTAEFVDWFASRLAEREKRIEMLEDTIQDSKQAKEDKP